jgi:hypothetical protein
MQHNLMTFSSSTHKAAAGGESFSQNKFNEAMRDRIAELEQEV